MFGEIKMFNSYVAYSAVWKSVVAFMRPCTHADDMLIQALKLVASRLAGHFSRRSSDRRTKW